MLLTKKVKVKWAGYTKAYYISKGYIYTKLGDELEVKVEDLMEKSNTKINVKCDCCKKEIKNVIWQNYKKYVREDGKYYCQKCAREISNVDKKRVESFLRNGKSFEQWCIENSRQDVLDRWDYELNDCKPSEVTHSSRGIDRTGYWFKCPRGIHKSELKDMASFTSGQEGSIYCKQCNSFEQWCIDNDKKYLLHLWDYELNNYLPSEISYGSNKQIYFKCPIGTYKSYLKTITTLTSSSRIKECCDGKKIHMLDSLGQYIVDNYGKEFLKNVWSDKNDKSPFEYSYGSNKRVWWKCIDGEHDDFYRQINASNNYDFRCPSCMQERDESILQEKVRLYLESLGYTLLHEHKCTIVPKNPKTKHILPYDNEIKGFLKLIIEVHGSQHYKISRFHKMSAKKNKTTPEYELYMQQVRDRYKKIYAKSKGYNFLEIPYWTDNKKEEWKQLIDNKIEEILKLSA